MNIRTGASLLAVISLYACQDSDAPNTPQHSAATTPTSSKTIDTVDNQKIIGTATISGMHLRLSIEKTSCLLLPPEGKAIKLNMSEACRFHRTADGNVQIFEGHHGPVFLVVSSVSQKDSEDCDTQTAAVTIVDNKVYTEPAMTTSAGCIKNTTLDDIHFLGARFDGLAYPGD